MRGDANLDNVVNGDDAFLVLQYYAKKSVGATDCKFHENPSVNRWLLLLLDINGDSEITGDDAFYILLYYANHSVGKDVSWEELLK